MPHPYWPLADLRVRTPRVELRFAGDDDLIALARLAGEGIHRPDEMPFLTPWSVRPNVEQSVLQWHWRQRGAWTPDAWNLDFVVVSDGEVVGTQGVGATDFRITRAVSSGSWLGRRHQGRGLGKEMRSAMLHFAFAGLGAEVAFSGAFIDNAASLGVSRALGYVEDGLNVRNRQGAGTRERRLRLERADWEKTRRQDVEIEGIEPCLAMFGLD
ncbi:MAG: GNAT family N-acetyltransferase [Acidimicrobiia bacterium]